jgi:predicted  nucleic acid-binding Zn-ribbon protein
LATLPQRTHATAAETLERTAREAQDDVMDLTNELDTLRAAHDASAATHRTLESSLAAAQSDAEHARAALAEAQRTAMTTRAGEATALAQQCDRLAQQKVCALRVQYC